MVYCWDGETLKFGTRPVEMHQITNVRIRGANWTFSTHLTQDIFMCQGAGKAKVSRQTLIYCVTKGNQQCTPSDSLHARKGQGAQGLEGDHMSEVP